MPSILKPEEILDNLKSELNKFSINFIENENTLILPSSGFVKIEDSLLQYNGPNSEEIQINLQTNTVSNRFYKSVIINELLNNDQLCLNYIQKTLEDLPGFSMNGPVFSLEYKGYKIVGAMYVSGGNIKWFENKKNKDSLFATTRINQLLDFKNKVLTVLLNQKQNEIDHEIDEKYTSDQTETENQLNYAKRFQKMQKTSSASKMYDLFKKSYVEDLEPTIPNPNNEQKLLIAEINSYLPNLITIMKRLEEPLMEIRQFSQLTDQPEEMNQMLTRENLADLAKYIDDILREAQNANAHFHSMMTNVSENQGT